MHPILQEIRALDVSRPRLRSFGRVVGGILVVLGGLAFWKSGAGGWAYGLGGPGSVLVLLGQFAPMALTWVYRGWMAVASVLGFVMTRVILTVVFFGLVTPIGWIMRAFGHDPMHRRPDPSLETYWIPRDSDQDRPMTKYY